MLTIRRKPNCSHLEPPGFSDCLADVRHWRISTSTSARKRTVVQTKIPSLHIWYTRSSSKAPNGKCGEINSVQFFLFCFFSVGKYTTKSFWECWKEQTPQYTSGFLLCATICRAIWACHVAVHHIEQQSLHGGGNMGVLGTSWGRYDMILFILALLFNKCFSCSGIQSINRKPGDCWTSCFVSCKDLNIRLVPCYTLVFVNPLRFCPGQ